MLDSCHIDTAIEKALKSLRLNSNPVLPEPVHLDTSEIQLDSDRQVWQAFLDAHPQLENWASRVNGCKVAIDLDETLLINSQICPDLWQIGKGYQDRTIYSAYQYASMHKTWQDRLRRAIGRTHYDTTDVARYPFLKNPRQIVMFRPGMLSGLSWLKTLGVRLILVTACDRQRVDYLLKRFPLFAGIFDEYIITANDMARYYLTSDRQCHEGQDRSSIIHRLRPYSLAAKTPALVSSILKMGEYDLIVDDSNTIAELFGKSELGHKLLWVRSDLPVGGYGLEIVATIVAQLTQNGSQSGDGEISRLQPNPECDRFSARQALVRLEDPYYWSLCHATDQLSIETSN